MDAENTTMRDIVGELEMLGSWLADAPPNRTEDTVRALDAGDTQTYEQLRAEQIAYESWMAEHRADLDRQAELRDTAIRRILLLGERALSDPHPGFRWMIGAVPPPQQAELRDLWRQAAGQMLAYREAYGSGEGMPFDTVLAAEPRNDLQRTYQRSARQAVAEVRRIRAPWDD